MCVHYVASIRTLRKRKKTRLIGIQSLRVEPKSRVFNHHSVFVYLAVCLSDHFSKPVSYNFSLIYFKFYKGIKYDVTDQACAFFFFFDDRTIFGFLANFWNCWNTGRIYINLLQFSCNRFEIICRIEALWLVLFFWKSIFFNNGMIYSNCEMSLVYSFHSIVLKV